MKIPIYQIDAFAEHVFEGNPAAVCPLREWLDDAVLQAVARENNLSETAFYVPEDEGYHIRWFTPVAEVDLCGHATLGTAYVILHELEPSLDRVTFRSRSGMLKVDRQDDMLAMDFPAQPPRPCDAPSMLAEALGRPPLEILASEDYFAVLAKEEDVMTLEPDFNRLKELDRRGIIVTAMGNQADFVSRFFAPKLGIDEDPVTGSAHCALTPYWANRLGKSHLRAHQRSKRGGSLYCEDRGDRVLIAGKAVKYLEGHIII
jgi:PhzF family phenazine biosynthesis protein